GSSMRSSSLRTHRLRVRYTDGRLPAVSMVPTYPTGGKRHLPDRSQATAGRASNPVTARGNTQRLRRVVSGRSPGRARTGEVAPISGRSRDYDGAAGFDPLRTLGVLRQLTA